MTPMVPSFTDRMLSRGRGVIGAPSPQPQVPGTGVMGLPSGFVPAVGQGWRDKFGLPPGFAQAAGAMPQLNQPQAAPQPDMQRDGGQGWKDKLGLVAAALQGGPSQSGPQPMSPMTQPLPMQIQPLMPQTDFQRFFMGGGGGMNRLQGLLG